MRRVFFRRVATVGMLLYSLALFWGCAMVKPYEREKLSDPIMDPASHFGKQTLEQKFFSTREGSAGGGTGVGGGCGCAK
jgi:hypothetical protein